MAVEDKKEEILTINECAELLKVSPWLIYNLESEEKAPGKSVFLSSSMLKPEPQGY
jgi:predicted DNA-binding transcriptional regulator AlpA